MSLEKKLRVLTKLANYGGDELKIIFSEATKKYYVSISSLDIKDGGFLSGAVEHRHSIEAAVESYIECLQGNLLVFNAFDKEKRKEIFFYTHQEKEDE
jgi:isopropylmalate/homocitrate/citramalate synthase